MKNPLSHVAALVGSAVLNLTLLQGVAMLAQTTGRSAAVVQPQASANTAREAA